MSSTINLTAFSHLPDQARLWIYGFSRPLRPEDREIVETEVSRFIAHWTTHGSPVQAAGAVINDRFLVLSAFHPEGVSGCSIDSSVAMLRHLKQQYGLDGLSGNLIFYRSADGEVCSQDYFEFQETAASGAVGPRTPVFDTTLTTLEELRAGKMELTFHQSWHARAFPIPV